jgi:hypothetical protein
MQMRRWEVHNEDPCNRTLLPHLGLPGPPVHVPFNNPGRLGNRLFQVAAALILANRTRSPVGFARQIADDLADFPCAQTQPAHERVGPGHVQAADGPYHQDLSAWGAGGPHALKRGRNLTEYGKRKQRCGSVDASQQAQCGLATTHWRPLLRAAFVTPRLDASMQGVELPEPDALVFHFRDHINCKGSGLREGLGSAGQRATATVAESAYGDDERDGSDGKLPPSSFFDTVIALHRQRWPTGRVWIVCQPCERQNPAVQRILRRWPNAATLRLRDGSALKDFAWVRSARHVGIAPGTFGWWASYLSDDAQTIYYPALPSASTQWCLTMPTDDPRYRFVRAKQGPARGGTVDAVAARRECLVAQTMNLSIQRD